MKKKGFTLIEIIIVIALISVIGVGSFVGVKTVQKNIKADKLEDISDKIIEAVSVYIESNTEARKQLYNNENGVLVPLNVLKNEGLIDFQDIKVDDKDYVITMLGSSSSDSACIDTTTIGSWEDGNKTIYLCTDKDGNSNLTSIGFSGNNLSLTSKSRVWFYNNYLGSNYGVEASGEAKANNNIKFGENVYKIYYIDRDDSLALLSFDSFGNVFNGKTQNIDYYKRNLNCVSGTDNLVKVYNDSRSTYADTYMCTEKQYDEKNGEVPLGFNEIWNSHIIRDEELLEYSGLRNCCTLNGDILELENKNKVIVYFLKDKMGIEHFGYTDFGGDNIYGFKNNNKLFKIQLKPCMKINSGVGTKSNPYILKDYCS